MFDTLENYKPRPAALIQGVLITVVTFWAVSAAVRQAAQPLNSIIGSVRSAAGLLPFDRSSILPAHSATRVRVAVMTSDPWDRFAEAYFRIILVLGALDLDQDHVISIREIERSPETLQVLDRDGDGKLSAEECGFCLGPGEPEGCTGEPGKEGAGLTLSIYEVERAKGIFMAMNPVLAALDENHDAEISAEEIRRAPVNLRTLDVNHDGALLPVEVAPAAVLKALLANPGARPRYR